MSTHGLAQFLSPALMSNLKAHCLCPHCSVCVSHVSQTGLHFAKTDLAAHRQLDCRTQGMLGDCQVFPDTQVPLFFPQTPGGGHHVLWPLQGEVPSNGGAGHSKCVSQPLSTALYQALECLLPRG